MYVLCIFLNDFRWSVSYHKIFMMSIVSYIYGLFVPVITQLVLFQFKQAVYKQTMKLFAELEIKRKEREAKDMHER